MKTKINVNGVYNYSCIAMNDLSLTFMICSPCFDGIVKVLYDVWYDVLWYHGLW